MLHDACPDALLHAMRMTSHMSDRIMICHSGSMLSQCRGAWIMHHHDVTCVQLKGRLHGEDVYIYITSVEGIMIKVCEPQEDSWRKAASAQPL